MKKSAKLLWRKIERVIFFVHMNEALNGNLDHKKIKLEQKRLKSASDRNLKTYTNSLFKTFQREMTIIYAGEIESRKNLKLHLSNKNVKHRNDRQISLNQKLLRRL